VPTPEEEPEGWTPKTGGANAAGGPGGVPNRLGGRQNLMGILSALFGVITLCCGPCLGFGGSGGAFLFDILPAIVAIGTGIVHLQRIKQGRATNRNLATIGIALGVVGLVIAICLSSTRSGVQWHDDIT
jgi:hypothetical protein